MLAIARARNEVKCCSEVKTGDGFCRRELIWGTGKERGEVDDLAVHNAGDNQAFIHSDTPRCIIYQGSSLDSVEQIAERCSGARRRK